MLVKGGWGIFHEIQNGTIMSKRAKKVPYDRLLNPMSLDELRSRVELSMEDFEAGRIKSSEELLKKYSK